MIGFKVINYYNPGFGKVEQHMLGDLEFIYNLKKKKKKKKINII